MVKHQGKITANFRNIYGHSLISNIDKINGCLQVSLRNKPIAFFSKYTVLIGSISAIVLLASLLAINISIIIVGLIITWYILYKTLFCVTEENVLFIKGFGCHIYKDHWFGKRTHFIPYEQIEKVFINEVILRNRIVYLLTLLTKENQPKLIPLFVDMLPRIDCLEIIYKTIKFFEDK